MFVISTCLCPIDHFLCAAEAAHERAALLAHRTAVPFPVRLSEPGRFPLNGTEDFITAPVCEAAPQLVEPFEPLAEEQCESLAPEEALGSAGPTGSGIIASSEPQDTAAESSSSSSSSSDSDSDFDSDSEDKFDREAKIRNASSECADATPGETKGTNEVTGGVQHSGRGLRGRSEESDKLSPETGSGTPAGVIENAAGSLLTDAHSKAPLLHVAQAEAPVEVSKESQRVAAPRLVKSKIIPPEADAETLSTAEDLKDPVLLSAEVPDEDVSLETAAEQLKGTHPTTLLLLNTVLI